MGRTSNAGLPNYKDNDYAAIARGMGLERVFAVLHASKRWSAIFRR